MIIVTTDFVVGKTVARTIGLVKGNTIQSRHVGKDIRAGLKSIVGGELDDYTEMLASARDEAIARMVADAEAQGANAIIGMRLATSMIMQSASEVLAYGTAVVLE